MLNVKTLFETDLPAAMIAKSKEVQAINAQFQVNIIGEGEWFIDASPKGPTVAPGQGKANCTITISSKDFETLMKDPGRATMMFLMGKLKVSGNQMLAMKLTKLLDLK